MASDLEEFVAEDLWLFIAIVTFGTLALLSLAGLEVVTGPIAVVGWFILTPIFLFWGEEIARLVFDEEREQIESTVDSSEDDALSELKRRYAAGEIDDETFERRLERLVALEDLPSDVLRRPETVEDDLSRGYERRPPRDAPTDRDEREADADATAEREPE